LNVELSESESADTKPEFGLKQPLKVILGHSKDCISPYNIAGPISSFRRSSHLQINRQKLPSLTNLCRLTPTPEEAPRISAYSIYF